MAGLFYNTSMKKSANEHQLLCRIKEGVGTPFQKEVWLEITQIPKGEIITYTELARRIGRPGAARAVANACGANPYAPEVPCHRIIRSDGALGGYSGKGGVTKKERLLRTERAAR